VIAHAKLDATDPPVDEFYEFNAILGYTAGRDAPIKYKVSNKGGRPWGVKYSDLHSPEALDAILQYNNDHVNYLILASVYSCVIVRVRPCVCETLRVPPC